MASQALLPKCPRVCPGCRIEQPGYSSRVHMKEYRKLVKTLKTRLSEAAVMPHYAEYMFALESPHSLQQTTDSRQIKWLVCREGQATQYLLSNYHLRPLYLRVADQA
jgi:hypothetical protein